MCEWPARTAGPNTAQVRIGHFSYRSASVGSVFPLQAPQHGWHVSRARLDCDRRRWAGSDTAQRAGLAAFMHRGEQCWLPELKQLLAENIPVILLCACGPLHRALTPHRMHFANVSQQDGHFRVAVGFDDDSVYLHDPWDREGDLPLVRFNDTACRLRCGRH